METSLKYLVFDRDRKFAFEVIAAVKATRIIPKRTSFRSPWQKRPRLGRGCRRFQHSELLPEHEILQNKIPTAMEGADQRSNPDEKQAEYGKELYQINHWKYCCKLLILQPARVLARHSGFWNVETKP
jgi:hypothetical protein